MTRNFSLEIIDFVKVYIKTRNFFTPFIIKNKEYL